MSDTFEHEKPYSLIAKYQESPAECFNSSVRYSRHLL
jgi:hypothetical protein